MPWQRRDVMDQKLEFVLLAREGVMPFSRLCARYGISRPTGYLWRRRYEQAGTVTALNEHSRRPHYRPGQTPPELEEQVVELRGQYGWGARKLRCLLQEGHLSEATINRIIARRGLLAPERPQPATQRFAREECNQLVQMDFKGDYPVREGRCYPLSLLDDHSRGCGRWATPAPKPPRACWSRFSAPRGYPRRC